MFTTPLIKSYRLIRTPEEAVSAFREINDYCTQVLKPKIAIDVETKSAIPCQMPEPFARPDGGYEGYMSTIQIGLDPDIFDRQYIFDVASLGDRFIQEDLKPILESPRIIKLGQNLKYDWRFFYTQYGIYMQKMRDTMLISQIQNAGDKIRHGLSFLYKEYFDFGWFKDITGKTFAEYEEYKKEMQISDWSGSLSHEQLRYASDDVRLIFFLYRRQMERLDYMIERGRCKNGIIDIIKLECDLIPAYAMMEIIGVGFDLEHHAKVIKYLEEKVKEASEEVGKYFVNVKVVGRGRGKARVIEEVRETMNMRSWQQIKKFLEPICGELEDTGEKTLKRFEDLHPAIPFILQYKKASSLLSKFGEKFSKPFTEEDGLLHEDGRLHPHWHQIGSDENAIDTGRSSCKDPNMQQIPARELLFGETVAAELFRRLIKARPGHKIISFDFSNIEPRATAQVTGDETLVAIFKDGLDQHAITAQAMLGLEYVPSKDDPRFKGNQVWEFQRNVIGKVSNLAMGYGIGPKALAKFMFDNSPKDNKVEWSVNEAKENIERYFQKYSGIRTAMLDVERQVRKVFANHDSLADFKGRKLIFGISHKGGRKRDFFLTAEQERMARECPEKLGKYYKAFRIVKHTDKETGETWEELVPTQNEYNKRLGKIAREAYNFLIQGLCADILKIAVLNIHRKLREYGLPDDQGIIMVVHDEIVLEVEDVHVENVRSIVQDAMIAAASLFIKRVPVKVDGTAGETWGDAH